MPRRSIRGASVPVAPIAKTLQNPWTKVDPEGLRKEQPEDTASIKTMQKIAKVTRAAAQRRLDAHRQDQTISDERRQQVPAVIKRTFDTADGLERASSRLRSEIADVPDGKPDPGQLRVKLEALKLVIDTETGKRFDSTRVGRATCNELTDYVFERSGMKGPEGFGWGKLGFRPLRSREWYAKKSHPIKDREMGGKGEVREVFDHDGSSEISPSSLPSSTGVISYREHVAIYIGDGLAVGSTQTQPIGVSRGPVSIISTKDSEPFRILQLQLPNR